MNSSSNILTYQEFRDFEFDNSLPSYYELVRGKILEKESPSIYHQQVIGNLLVELKIFTRKIELGKVISGPIDVVLDNHNVYLPDLFFVKRKRYFVFENEEEIVIGAPDLVVEVLSKSTAFYDKGDKKDIYEKYGVREYWLIDPIGKTIEIYSFENERFKLNQLVDEKGEVKSLVLQGFELKAEKIFEE